MARTKGAATLSAEDIAKIWAAAAAGRTYAAIAKEMGLDQSTVARHGRVKVGLRSPGPARRRLTGDGQ